MKTNSILLGLLLLTVFRSSYAQDWRSIVPLKTTRSEVEALLGQNDSDYMAIYNLNDGNLSVEYSSGPCRPDRKGGWNVAENVVVSLYFSPKVKRRWSDLKLDRKKLRKVVDTHVGGVIYYINDEDGVVYEIQSGKVDSVEYGASKKHAHLRCDNNLQSPLPY